MQDGSFSERPDGSGTPRSMTTGTPPSEQRSTATPVVSVLSLDFQQEKDFASLQGGRRPPQQPYAHNNNNTMQYRHSLPPTQQQQPPPHQHQHRRGGHQINGAPPRRPFNNGCAYHTPHNTEYMQVL